MNSLDIGKPTRDDLLQLDPETVVKLDRLNDLIDKIHQFLPIFENDITDEYEILQPLYNLRYKYQNELSKKYWDQFPEVKREVIANGIWGHLYTADIHIRKTKG